MCCRKHRATNNNKNQYSYRAARKPRQKSVEKFFHSDKVSIPVATRGQEKSQKWPYQCGREAAVPTARKRKTEAHRFENFVHVVARWAISVAQNPSRNGERLLVSA